MTMDYEAAVNTWVVNSCCARAMSLANKEITT